MAKKNRRLQRMRRRFVAGCAWLNMTTLNLLPFDFALWLGGRWGRVAFMLLGRERRRTIGHLRTAFGEEKSEQELHELARRVFVHAGRAVAEMAVMRRWTDERLRNRIVLENPEKILDVLRPGKGCVILTAHYGNWELLGLYAVKILGINMGVIARHLSNPYLDDMTTRHREQMGLKVFFRGDRATKIVRHVLKGGALGILADHDVKRLDGIFIDFFGQPAHTLTGPAELIVRTKVPWFFSVLRRNPDGRSYYAVLEGPYEAPEGKDRAEQVRKLLERYTHRLEEVVREHPEQWMWMHNRWQRKPPE